MAAIFLIHFLELHPVLPKNRFVNALSILQRAIIKLPATRRLFVWIPEPAGMFPQACFMPPAACVLMNPKKHLMYLPCTSRLLMRPSFLKNYYGMEHHPTG